MNFVQSGIDGFIARAKPIMGKSRTINHTLLTVCKKMHNICRVST